MPTIKYETDLSEFDLNSFSKSDLLQIAHDNDLHANSRMTKKELIEVLNSAMEEETDEDEDSDEDNDDDYAEDSDEEKENDDAEDSDED